jgi:thymidylate synthase (FAD)
MEPIAVYEPKIELYSWTAQPLTTIATGWLAMHQQNLIHPGQLPFTNALEIFQEVIEHQHKTVLEYITFTFGLSDVSRAFQQQITRHRVGVSFSIQSLRHVDLSNHFRYVVPHDIRDDKELEKIYQDYMHNIKDMYEYATTRMPVQAARGLLPLNICSNITMTINYRALFEMASQRFCATTQGEFQDVMSQIRWLIKTKVNSYLGNELMAKCDRTKICNQGRWSCGKYPTRNV